ncbi:hypothetical protein GGR57DRAFT_184564 [Xylariaceae sp. FL1272]|nr:hypothetical protein GGR57DRAFT_184564 [Xylariaceae sp. FL1272]
MVPTRGVKRGHSEITSEAREKGPKQTKLSHSWSLAPHQTTSSKTSDPESTPKPRSKKQTAPKPVVIKAPAPGKLFKDALKAVDKTFNRLLKAYKPNPKGCYGITADDFAKAMYGFSGAVDKLLQDSPSLALDLLLDLGEHAYGDLEACVKSSGFGDTDEFYQSMDKKLVEVIDKRREAQSSSTADQSSEMPTMPVYKIEPSKADFGGEEDALRELIGTKVRRNKSENRALARARISDLNVMFETRRRRRETTKDWAGNALNDLTETQARIDEYGIGDHYFHESIGLLASMKGVKWPQ